MPSRTLRLLAALLAVLLLALPADSPALSKKTGKKKPFNKKDWIWQPDAFPVEKKAAIHPHSGQFFYFL
ncbi:hypothetical protein VU07_00585 [Desulfobulbus sp. F4]|nr:hypothetical protein [Desulfobulbus sp. F4]